MSTYADGQEVREGDVVKVDAAATPAKASCGVTGMRLVVHHVDDVFLWDDHCNCAAPSVCTLIRRAVEPANPDWQRRAEEKEFLDGDVCVVLKPAPGCSRHIVRGYIGTIAWQSGMSTPSFAHIPCSHCEKENVALLRPVEWQPQVGERVVCIEAIYEEGSFTVDVGNVKTVEQRWHDHPAWRKYYAPAILAEPLIPLLRGKDLRDESVDQHVKGIYDDSGPCEGCGKTITGHQRFCCNGMCSECHDAEVHRLRVENGLGINGTNRTLRAIAADERWTADFPRRPRYCRRCGSDAGCMCEVCE